MPASYNTSAAANWGSSASSYRLNLERYFNDVRVRSFVLTGALEAIRTPASNSKFYEAGFVGFCLVQNTALSFSL